MTRDGIIAARWSNDGKFLLTCNRSSIFREGYSEEVGVEKAGEESRFPGPGAISANQIWEVSCPIPTYEILEPVDRLYFRADGRLLAVNNTAWDVAVGNERIALRQKTVMAPGNLLGFNEAEIWGISPVVGSSNQNDDRNSPTMIRRRLRCSVELGVAMILQPITLGPGPGALTAIGKLPFDKIVNLGLIQWERPRVIRLFPVNQEVVLAPPTDSQSNHKVLDETKISFGINYSEPYRAAWSPDGNKVLAIVSVGCVYFLDRAVPGVESSHGVVSLGSDRFIQAWDIPSGKRYSLALAHGGWKDISWNPQGRHFATVRKYLVQVWDLATGTEVATIAKEEFDRILWSNDGLHLLAVKQDKKAAVFTTDGVQTWAGSADAKDWTAYGLSGEGRYVVSGGEDGLVHFLDVETGKEVARWQAHDAAVTALTFSPDGTLLVRGCRKTT